MSEQQQPAQPKPRKRDSLFLNSNNDGLSFAFGFGEGHLPVAATSADEASTQQQAQQQGDDDGAVDGEQQSMMMIQQLEQQKTTSDAAPITFEQVSEARRGCQGAGLKFFAAPQTAKLNPETHAQHVRAVFDKSRQEAAIAQLVKARKQNRDADDE